MGRQKNLKKFLVTLGVSTAFVAPIVHADGMPSWAFEEKIEKMKLKKDYHKRKKGKFKKIKGWPNKFSVNPPNEFQSINGEANNQTNPDWGKSKIPLIRIVNNNYLDGFGLLNDNGLPSPREVSNQVFAQSGNIETSSGTSDMLWQWGQFIDHDIDLTEPGPLMEPANIVVPFGDPQFDPFRTGMSVIPFTRSIFEDLSRTLGIREQLNEITAYLDGSMVYGSDEERALFLRAFDGDGKLKVSEGDYLPFNDPNYPLPNAGGPSPTLFVAGDIRANEQVGLATMHTLFVREHNYIAEALRDHFPYKSGDDIYLMARALVASEIQHITYNEFLPALIGKRNFSRYSCYDPSVNPGIINGFSTAAYRIGHTMLSPVLQRLDKNGDEIGEGSLTLRDAFFNPNAVVEAGLSPILRGLTTSPHQQVDAKLVDDVRNFLFGPPGAGGLDLASLNIQRGRDHGLGSFNSYRVALGLAPYTDFSWARDAETEAALQTVYIVPDNVEPWVGMLAEKQAKGSLLGKTATKLIAMQFEALRDGDRFYFENALPKRWKKWVESQSLKDIIVRNTAVKGKEIGKSAFHVPEDRGRRGRRGRGRRR